MGDQFYFDIKNKSLDSRLMMMMMMILNLSLFYQFLIKGF